MMTPLAAVAFISPFSSSSDVSNSSHESRVGSIRERERKAVVPLAIISTLATVGLIVLIGIFIYWRWVQPPQLKIGENALVVLSTRGQDVSGNLFLLWVQQVLSLPSLSAAAAPPAQFGGK